MFIEGSCCACRAGVVTTLRRARACAARRHALSSRNTSRRRPLRKLALMRRFDPRADPRADPFAYPPRPPSPAKQKTTALPIPSWSPTEFCTSTGFVHIPLLKCHCLRFEFCTSVPSTYRGQPGQVHPCGPLALVYGHTSQNAPYLVRSAKLSWLRLPQYFGGGPRGNR